MALTNVDLDRIDGNSGTLANVNTSSVNGGPLAGFRNQIINGSFLINQRYGETVKADPQNGFVPDRWRIASSGSEPAFTAATAGAGFSNVAGLSSILSLAGMTVSNSYTFQQPIEIPVLAGAGRSLYRLGQVLTVSLYSDPGATIKVNCRYFDQSQSPTSVVDLTGGYQPLTETTLDASWSRYSYTFTINADPVTASRIMSVAFQLTAASATAKFTGVQLEPGPVATPFEHRPIGTELALCQRYFQKYLSQYFPGVSAQTTRWEQKIVPAMRADPSVDNIVGTIGALVSVTPRDGNVQWQYTPNASNLFSRSFDLDAEL